ncbi:MAG: lipopolysaccharide biosynthesis protein [Myxococcota bacterium]
MWAPEAGWFSAEQLRKDLGGRTVRGGAFFAASRTVRGLIDVLATLVLARLLTPADYGLVGLAAAVTGFVTLFKDLGLSTATIQREDLRHAEVSKLFWINVGLGLLLSAITAASAPLLGAFFEEPRLVPIVFALSIGFAFGGASVQHAALLERNLLQGRLAWVEFGSVAGSSLAAVGSAWAGMGPWALVIQSVGLAGLRMVLLWGACGWRPSPPWVRASVSEHLAMGGHLTGFSIVNYLARNLDDVLVGRFVGTEALGLYQQAYRLLMIPLRQLNTPIGSVAKPALSRLVGEPERYRRAYLRILDKILLLTMPLGAFLLVHAGSVLSVVLGEQWRPAENVFRWLGLLMFSQPIGNSTGWLFISQGRTGTMLRWGVVGSGLAIVSFVVGLPWGAEGVALAYASSGVGLRLPLLLWWVGRTGPVRARDILRAVLPHVIGGLLGLLLVWRAELALPDTPVVLRLLVGLTVATVTQVAVVASTRSGREALADWASFRRAFGGTAS